MASVYDTVSDYFSGDISLQEVKKRFDKALIKAIYAPYKKSQRRSLVESYDKTIKEAADETKLAIETIAAQLDTGIKGQGRKAIEQAVEDYKDDFDEV